MKGQSHVWPAVWLLFAKMAGGFQEPRQMDNSIMAGVTLAAVLAGATSTRRTPVSRAVGCR